VSVSVLSTFSFAYSMHGMWLIDELCMTVHVSCPQVPLDSASNSNSELHSSRPRLSEYGFGALGRHEKNDAKVIIFIHLRSISIGLFRSSFPNIK
jgi:hypothetical protein